MPIIMECFEGEALKKFATLSDLPLIYLIGENDVEKVKGYMPEVAEYAHGLGPVSDLVFMNGFLDLAK